jgi:hypothetical protein
MINILDIFKSNIYATIIFVINIVIILYLIMLSYSIKKIYFYNEEKFNFLKNTIDDILESHELIQRIQGGIVQDNETPESEACERLQTCKSVSSIKDPNILNKKIQNKSKKQKSKIKKDSSNKIK